MKKTRPYIAPTMTVIEINEQRLLASSNTSESTTINVFDDYFFDILPGNAF